MPLWVALLEKAWAKLNGNYDRIILGTVDMGFMHLCGVPTYDLKHENYRGKVNLFWNELVLACKSNHMMVAGTSDDTKQMDQLMLNGLRANHCYSVL